MDNTFNGYLDHLFSAGGLQLARSISSWKRGIEYEVNFWTQWFATKGLNWPQDYLNRMQPVEISSSMTGLLPEDVRFARIIDVGAGPITRIGTHVRDGRGEIISVDPLANYYDRIIEGAGASPPIRSQFSFAEDLSSRFDLSSFDLVTCTNALDHSVEPVWGLLEMTAILRKGRFVFLEHRRCEAENENYSGFHQWNFDVEDGNFIIWNKTNRYDVTRILSGYCDVRVELAGDLLSVYILKVRDLPVDMLNYQRRIRSVLLEAMLRSDDLTERQEGN